MISTGTSIFLRSSLKSVSENAAHGRWALIPRTMAKALKSVGTIEVRRA
jgi:hypothetical protein